jgi:tetratricopeptide (TPR) repeat protein
MVVGNAQMNLGRYRKAEQNFQKALGLCKEADNRLRVNMYLARLYEREGDYAKVEKTYKAILEESPRNILALNNLAYTYADKLNRPEDAFGLIQRAMKLRPGEMNLVDTYAWALAKQGRFDEALKNLRMIANKATASPATLYHMGYVLENTGDLVGARDYYRRALESAKAKGEAALSKTIEEAVKRNDQKLSKE